MDAPARSRLFVLRHAHSSWAVPGERDHQRALDERGRRDAEALGGRIAAADHRIDGVVCSTARRATETLDALRAALSAKIAVEAADELYALGVEAYYGRARAQAGCAGLLMVGHNPMVEEFAISLCMPEGSADQIRLRAGLPTCGLAIIEFDHPLSEIGRGRGRLLGVLTPNDEHR